MADTRGRVDRALAALSEAQKAELLDLHIGPVIAGSTPDPKSDTEHLRNIVELQLRKQDTQQDSDLAVLEQRVAKMERFVNGTLVTGIVETLFDGIQRQLRDGGYMRHTGTWDPEQAYSKGSCVVDGGGTWLALVDAAKGAKPGKALEWRLIARGDAGSNKP